MIEFDRKASSASVVEEGLLATAVAPIRFGHLGCKVLRTVLEDLKKSGTALPDSVARLWDRKAPDWRKAPSTGAAGTVASALKRALATSNALGLELWDTMRGGSDYWRPGKLLSDAAAHFAEGVVSFRRLDALCPPAELLGEFRRDPSMPFAEYAERYADYLRAGGRLDLALGAVIEAQARKRVAIFLCTDPFIPGYAQGSEALSTTPFRSRSWPLQAPLRDAGCHRVVLTDLLGQRLREEGFVVRLLELDATRGTSTTLEFLP